MHNQQKGASPMADDNKNLAGAGERTSILPQSGAPNAEQTEVLPTHVPQAETAQMPPVAQQLLAPRQGSLHRRRPRGASAPPSPAPQQRCCPSALVRASSRMRPLWAMVITSTSRATRMVITTRATGTRTRVSGPVTARGDLGTVSSRGRAMVSKGPAAISGVPVVASRARARSREMLAALDRDLLRRVVVAPAANLEAMAVLTPQPRMRIRPPVER